MDNEDVNLLTGRICICCYAFELTDPRLECVFDVRLVPRGGLRLIQMVQQIAGKVQEAVLIEPLSESIANEGASKLAVHNRFSFEICRLAEARMTKESLLSGCIRHARHRQLSPGRILWESLA